RNSPYKDSRSRSFHSVLARIPCLRWVIQVVTTETEAPTSEPSAAAVAVTTVESIAHRPASSKRPDTLVLQRRYAEPITSTALIVLPCCKSATASLISSKR